MGANDTREQLDAALEENIRLEADNARLLATIERVAADHPTGDVGGTYCRWHGPACKTWLAVTGRTA